MAAKYEGIEKNIFSDVYLFFLKYKDMSNTDICWEVCLQDAKMLNFKYKDHPLARTMVSATLSQLEHIVNHKPLNGLTHDEWEKALEVAKKTPFK